MHILYTNCTPVFFKIGPRYPKGWGWGGGLETLLYTHTHTHRRTIPQLHRHSPPTFSIHITEICPCTLSTAPSELLISEKLS